MVESQFGYGKIDPGILISMIIRPPRAEYPDNTGLEEE
jgi:hypothetical protein